MTQTETPLQAQVSQTPATEYKSLLKDFTVRLCIAIALGVLILVSVELWAFFRRRHALNDAMEPAIKAELAHDESASEREYWREFEQANRVNYKQYVLWRRQPFQGRELSINQDGIRRTLHTRCDNQTFTIWMFGDSVMWGAGSPDDGTIPSFVAAEYEASGHPVCIVNFGEKGWSNTQEMLALIEELKHASRRPDVVLFYDGGTEAFTAYQNGKADVHSNFGSFKTFVENWGESKKAGFAYLRQTNTYRFLEKIAAKKPFHREPVTSVAPGPNPDVIAADVIQNYVQNMDIVNLLASKYGFRALFAWYPNMPAGHKALTEYEQQVLDMEYKRFPGVGAMYQAVYRKARELNRPDVIYLADILDDQKDSMYVGISHLKPPGNQIVARRLFEILSRENAAALKTSQSKTTSK